MIFAVLRLTCIVLFTASIPVLVLVRFKYSKVPAWILIALATASGWCLVYAHMSLRAPMLHAFDRAERQAAEEYMRHPPPPIRNPDGSWTVDNPYAIGDYLPEVYHPVASLIYGPVYLAGCWFGAWLFFRRSSPDQRRRLFLVSIGVVLIEWTAIICEPLKPPAIFSDEVLIYGWNPFFGPQLTLPLALIAAWLIGSWLPVVAARRLF